jgi:hypothetical protein
MAVAHNSRYKFIAVPILKLLLNGRFIYGMLYETAVRRVRK